MTNKGFHLMFSFDDGYAQDIHVAQILERYGFTGTFFIPNKCELTPEEIVELSKKHNIGGHTVTHPQDLKLLNDEELDYEIGENRKWLQELTGQPIKDFCYPRGRYDDRVIEAVKRAGYETARTTLIGWHFKFPPDQYRQHTTVHTYNRKEYDGEVWQEYARRMLKKALYASKNDIGYFHLWGHSFLELERNEWWDDFERLIAEIKESTKKYDQDLSAK
jgi:peptidoglycan/xylan/chitin deacetylase (PgdA/CDA1 family)